MPDCQPGDLTFIHLYYDTRISKGSSHDWSSISFAPDTIGADMRDAYEDSPPMGSQNACWTERELERELETGTGLNWCLGATHRNHCLVQKREFLPSPGTGTALCLSDKAISHSLACGVRFCHRRSGVNHPDHLRPLSHQVYRVEKQMSWRIKNLPALSSP